MAVKKDAVKETKTAAVETETKAAAKASTEDKATVKKTTAKKTAAKKTTARKTTAKKEMKVTTTVQYYGKEVEEKEMIANVKKAWTKAGHKVGDIKTMELYIKPEDAAVYYVINGTESGAVAF